MSHRVLILYAEVMGYTLSSIQSYLREFSDTKIYLIELDKAKLTPFAFNSNGFEYRKKSSFSSFDEFKEEIIKFDPSLVMVSGRMDSDYLKAARYFKRKGVQTLTLQDTQWENSLRQKIITKLSFYLYHQYFSGFWGSGELQTAFGLSLGYKQQDIYSGFYSADHQSFKKRKIEEISYDPNKIKFFSVGRLVNVKNFLFLAECIEEYNKANGTEHSLTIIGNGELKCELEMIGCVNVIDFVMPNVLTKLTEDFDIFCLPSIYEPWGLVVHEFACRGFPLMISNKCGSARTFVIDGYNGFTYDPKNFKQVFERIDSMSNVSLEYIKLMSERSTQLSKRITPETWSYTLRSIIMKY
jgi:glycosyltransferase involved in cell wall biosynthesis